MGKGYIPVFYDWIDVTSELDDEEKGRLIDAMVLYASGRDWQSKIKGNERFLFPAFKGQIDRNNEISETRANIRKKTGQTETNHIKPEQTETKQNKPEQNKTDDKKESKFTKPTVEDVAAYCKEKGFHVNPERFIDFYQSKGWKVGNQPMKDWRACVRTWEQRDSSNIKQMPAKRITAQDYEQRDYSQERESIDDMLGRLEHAMK